MSGEDAGWDEVKETGRRQREVHALPEEIAREARFDGSEVMWPRPAAVDAIQALAEQGHVVLGLDLRRYEADGRFYEVAWSAYEPSGSEDAPAGGAAALAALQRPNIVEMDGYDWVLITWR